MGVTGLDFAVLTLEDILPLERVHHEHRYEFSHSSLDRDFGAAAT